MKKGHYKKKKKWRMKDLRWIHVRQINKTGSLTKKVSPGLTRHFPVVTSDSCDELPGRQNKGG